MSEDESERKLEGFDRVARHEKAEDFDPSKCDTCRYLERGIGGVRKCGLCGCLVRLMAEAFKYPPETCPQLD